MSETSGKPASARSARFPRRFYKEASVGAQEAGFAILLDGRAARTPAGNPLAVASQRVAEALAVEWAAQGERLDPAAMPLTRIVNSAIDGVSREMDAVRTDIVRHAGSDLVCYRAEGPEGLVAKQEAAWAPLLAFAREALGARFVLAEGVMHVKQSPEALAAIGRALQDYDAISLAAMHVVTTLTGSALIALALGKRQISAEEAWAAAHVDEDWQMSQWGEDEQALARRAARRRDFDAAAFVLGAV
jgi:chaperone required for assembly of F1-ATPase